MNNYYKGQVRSMKYLGINVICVIVLLLCVVVIFRGQYAYGETITFEGFIGVMTTFIGICATMMVGLQIYNHLQIREVAESVKNIHKLENEQREIIKKLRFAQKGVSDLFRLQARKPTEDYVPICLAVSVITMYEDGITDCKVLDDIHEKYKKLWEYCKRHEYNYRLLIRYLPDFQRMYFNSSIKTSKDILEYHVKFLNRLYEEEKKIKTNK